MYGKTLSDYPGKYEAFNLALKDLKPEQIDFAFQEAVKTLTEFPTPAQILEFANGFYGRPELKSFPELGSKPVERVDPGATKDRDTNYNRMVEAYKAKHREENAARKSNIKLPTDTRVVFDAELERVSAANAMDAPGKTLHEQQRAEALQRLGGSSMPMPIRTTVAGESPEVRPEVWQANREWHERMAVKNGWKNERQPGEDE